MTTDAELPYLVFADSSGKIYDHPYLRMAASSGVQYVLPEKDEIIKLPGASRFFTLPGRQPVGWNEKEQGFEVLSEFELDGRKIKPQAVSCFLPPAYTRTLLPASRIEEETMLPLWSYTALGWKDGEFCAAGIRVDESDAWNPRHFDERVIEPEVKKRLKESSNNRLLKQLGRCALEYRCFTARNVFLRRSEIALPASPYCNANCVGCISLQESECCPSSQERINFVPSPEEITEIAVPHLERVKNAIASFGQGCEGEPLLAADVICEAIREIRRRTDKGTINMNTNGSLPSVLPKLAGAGIQSVRVSLNSTREAFYNIYYRQSSYKFKDVLEFIGLAKKLGLFVSINLLVFPGFTDSEEEYDGLASIIGDNKIDLVQMRNLNIDPDYYLRSIGFKGAKRIGITRMVANLKKRFPRLQFGYFNKPC
ncbi:MAG: radical SAM protein [Candidatus Omnitrophica bacterium]|nr:radical SAM protein [Candidatus Omnitrophota bacterium]